MAVKKLHESDDAPVVKPKTLFFSRSGAVSKEYTVKYYPEVDVDYVWLYVENSTYICVVLGPEEEVKDRAIKSSRSLNTFWKSLIVAADAEDYPGLIDKGPKVEFTVNDIGLILKTLWLYAYLIPFIAPIQRVVFYVLDRRRLVVTFTIWRNKLRANALEHKKGEKFQFTTTLLFYQLFCVTYFVGVIGVYFNAFKVGYRSVDELLYRPNFEYVDYTIARIYAFRLGALNNYQTERVREDLTRKRFGPYAGGTGNEPLFKVLRDLSIQSDPRAPIEASAEQKAYFAEANNLRAMGRSTAGLQERSRPSTRRSSSADVGELMRLRTGEAGFGNRSESSPELVFDDRAEDLTEKAIAWLLCYAEMDRAVAEATEITEEKRTSTSASTSNSICLICDKSYTLRRSLTRHFQKKHSVGTFEHPFPYPQYYRDGVNAPPTVSSPEEWYDYIGMYYGKINVPVVVARSKAAAARLDDTKALARKPARRKREEEITPAEPLILGTSVLDFLFREEPSETSEIVFLENTPRDLRYSDLVSNSGLSSSGSGDGWDSPATSADTIDMPGLESPMVSSFELALPVGNADLLDLANLDDSWRYKEVRYIRYIIAERYKSLLM
ncbi:hypothetical protein QBC40DRAFT_329797 [Triangularia verruculosa]|uniref:C2H2-type domain-containing protein n=1 Tax=Triangularia verruculosa TaxID=2587418 RepID=A0AAN6XGI2_9PEZI|nr:hypothetical protein QBC40DRAFT_329797 [Triangularia verruculosa]